jgi:hypothetical protein
MSHVVLADVTLASFIRCLGANPRLVGLLAGDLASMAWWATLGRVRRGIRSRLLLSCDGTLMSVVKQQASPAGKGCVSWSSQRVQWSNVAGGHCESC